MGRPKWGVVRIAKQPVARAALAAILVLFARQAAGITAQRVASGLTQPLYVTAPAGDFSHIYIVQQTGRILQLDLNTGQLSTFFTVTGLTSTSGEQGLLGLAFDPNYATNRKFYLNFTVPGGSFGNGVTHVSQFTAAPAAATTQAPEAQQATGTEVDNQRAHPNRRRLRRFPNPTPIPTATPIQTPTPTATPVRTPTPTPTVTPV